MPHFIIECSQHVPGLKKPEAIMQAVYDTAAATGLFAQNDIKVRLKPYEYYKPGETKNDFIHIFGHIREGRSTEQKASLPKKIIVALNQLLPDVSILSINISDFERATWCNKSLINPLNTGET
jgi:5-carboxymethyl-2-hydroxymuconate isomerase